MRRTLEEDLRAALEPLLDRQVNEDEYTLTDALKDLSDARAAYYHVMNRHRGLPWPMDGRSVTRAQRRLMLGLLRSGGGMFDKYYRVVAGGGALTTMQSTTPLVLLVRGWVHVLPGRRLELTGEGYRRALVMAKQV